MFKGMKNFLGNFIHWPLFCITRNCISSCDFPL